MKSTPIQTWRLAIGLALCACLVFSPILTAGYLRWDDHKTIFENPDFTPPVMVKWGHYWTKPYLQLYMPLTYSAWGLVAFAAQSTDNGKVVLDPGAYHLLSLLLHALCTLLVFAILRRLVESLWPAFFGALLFAVHPIQTEAVAWATVASIPLSTAFALWALWEYLRFSDARQQGGPADYRWLHFALGTVAFALAILSKSSAVVLPLIAVAIDVILRRRPVRSTWPVILWLLMTIPIVLLTRAAQPARSIHVTLWQRPIIALDALAFYLYKLLIPFGYFPDYGRSPRWVFAHPIVPSLTWLAPAALLVVCVALWRKDRWIAGASLIFAIGLLPLLGLTPFIFQKFSTVADRYAYLAMLGPAILAAHLLARWPTPAVLRVAAGVCVVLGGLGLWQSRYWHDTLTLFHYQADNDPESLQVSYVLGQYYVNESEEAQREGRSADAAGKLQDALSRYQTGVRTHPEDARLQSALGSVLYRLGRYQEALDHYHVAMNDPDFMSEYATEAYDNLGMALFKSGKPREAESAYREALRHKADDALAKKGLAQLGLTS